MASELSLALDEVEVAAAASAAIFCRNSSGVSLLAVLAFCRGRLCWVGGVALVEELERFE